MKFVTHLVSLDFKADTATFHLPPGTRMSAGTYVIRLLSGSHADNGVELGLDLLRRARTHLPLAAMSWNESEDRTVAAFHAKAVLDLIQEIDAAIAAGPPESCRSNAKPQPIPGDTARELLGHLYVATDANGCMTMMAWEHDDGRVPDLVSTAMHRGEAVTRIARFKDDGWQPPGWVAAEECEP